MTKTTKLLTLSQKKGIIIVYINSFNNLKYLKE